MRCRPLVAAAVVAVSALCAPAAQAQTVQPRIISGSDVPISAYPFQVRVRVGSGGLCGGSILDADTVITAAHCATTQATPSSPHVALPANQLRVFYGSDNLSTQSSVAVSASAVPTQYTALTAWDDSYDVAILTLATPIALNGPNAKAIQLAHPSQPKALGGGIVTGWGTTSEGGSTSQTLKGVRVPLVADSGCSTAYGSAYVAARAVCAGGGTSPSGNPDTCQGDSGGPLVVDLDSSTAATNFVLLGLTSFGTGCGRQNTPAVYTYVQETAVANFISTASGGSNFGASSFTSGDFEAGTPGAARSTTGTTVPPIPTAPTPVPALRDTTRPTARVSSVTCKKHRCSLRIASRDPGGRVAKLSAKVGRTVKVCRLRDGRKVCRSVRRTRTLTVRRVTGGFAASVKLAPDTYRLTAVATDAAGNRSTATTRRFRVKP